MRNLLNQLIRDQRGMILSSEVVLVGTILVLGSIVGLAAVSHAVTHELNDVANAYRANNGYSGRGPQTGSGYSSTYSGSNDSYAISDSPGVPEVVGGY